MASLSLLSPLIHQVSDTLSLCLSLEHFQLIPIPEPLLMTLSSRDASYDLHLVCFFPELKQYSLPTYSVTSPYFILFIACLSAKKYLIYLLVYLFMIHLFPQLRRQSLHNYPSFENCTWPMTFAQ